MELVKYNNNSISSVTALGSLPAGDLNLITTNTISAGSSSSFTSNINSTYDTYIFKFINIHANSDTVNFFFNGSSDGGSNYNVTKTTTTFHPYHGEAGGDTQLAYSTASDLAQSTASQKLSSGVNLTSGSDEGMCGEMFLFSPSNTTFVKNFIARTQTNGSSYCTDNYTAGYFNTTSAINAVQFTISSGTFDGTIKMYGLSKS
tara:strand:+ start:1087 stop:1695 length:609 start_codon:yes stop_codon:yes gene_type:complete